MRVKFSMTLVLALFCAQMVAAQGAASVLKWDDNDPFQQELAHAREFTSVYAVYIRAIMKGRAAGVKEITTPDFALTWADHTRRGTKAYAVLHQYLGDPDKEISVDNFIVKVRRLTEKAYSAVAETEETMVLGLPATNGGDKTNRAIASGTSHWKQTWRKTGKGWRLARWDMAAEKLPGPTPMLSFTVQWKDIQTPATPPAASAAAK